MQNSKDELLNTVTNPKKNEKKSTTKSKKSSTTNSNKKSTSKKAIPSKVAKKSTSSATEKRSNKTSTSSKKLSKNSTSVKKSGKISASKSKKIEKSVASKSVAISKPNIVEYYDLPYRYNQTVVKILAQNPNTLFVYWDIADNDRLNFENKYGNNFFNITKPVLVVHNLTDDYSYEIDIDDFANNWYIHVDDTKCKYVVELGRRPIEKTADIPVNYLNISYSNTLEMPNDHVIFFKENDKIYFKNIKTNKVIEKVFKTKEYGNNLKEIYSNYNLSENENDRFDFKNPSSQNPTSNVL